MNDDLQPVDLLVVSETEDELVDNPVSANRATDQLEGCVIRVAVDEVVQIEVAQTCSPNASGQLKLVSDLLSATRPREQYRGNMIHIWLLYHRRHGFLNGPIPKFIIRMLVPDLLEVKVWAIEMLLEENDSASMSHAGCRYFEV